MDLSYHGPYVDYLKESSTGIYRGEWHHIEEVEENPEVLSSEQESVGKSSRRSRRKNRVKRVNVVTHRAKSPTAKTSLPKGYSEKNYMQDLVELQSMRENYKNIRILKRDTTDFQSLEDAKTELAAHTERVNIRYALLCDKIRSDVVGAVQREYEESKRSCERRFRTKEGELKQELEDAKEEMKIQHRLQMRHFEAEAQEKQRNTTPKPSVHIAQLRATVKRLVEQEQYKDAAAFENEANEKERLRNEEFERSFFTRFVQPNLQRLLSQQEKQLVLLAEKFKIRFLALQRERDNALQLLERQHLKEMQNAQMRVEEKVKRLAPPVHHVDTSLMRREGSMMLNNSSSSNLLLNSSMHNNNNISTSQYAPLQSPATTPHHHRSMRDSFIQSNIQASNMYYEALGRPEIISDFDTSSHQIARSFASNSGSVASSTPSRPSSAVASRKPHTDFGNYPYLEMNSTMSPISPKSPATPRSPGAAESPSRKWSKRPQSARFLKESPQQRLFSFDSPRAVSPSRPRPQWESNTQIEYRFDLPQNALIKDERWLNSYE